MPGLAYNLALGVHAGLRRTKNRLLNLLEAPLIVLVYHRVTTLPRDPQQLAVSPDNFRAQLCHLKETLPVLGLADDWSTRRGPAVAISFDDGYADNALEALPIIEEIGVPVTFFVSTGNIGTSRTFWWDELEALTGGTGPYPDALTLADARERRSWPTASAAQRKILYQELQPLLRTMDLARREVWFNQLRLWGRNQPQSRSAHRCLTVAELRRLAATPGVTIGAHTVNHQPLSCLSREAQREEITASKRTLEGWLEREVTLFSYPYGGKTDYSEVSVELCREAGFTKALANFPGQAHRWSDPYRIPRQVARDWNRDQFAAMLRKFRSA